jgi:hypothetical protein
LLYDVIKQAETQLIVDGMTEQSNNLMNIAFFETDEDNIYKDVSVIFGNLHQQWTNHIVGNEQQQELSCLEFVMIKGL